MPGFTLSLSKGFTLIELIVVIAIIATLSVLLAVAYPQARSQQKLTLAEQTLQASLRAAQQAAINEERDDDCLTKARALAVPEVLCSDTGIVLNPSQSTMIVFADIENSNTNEYEPDEGLSGDFKIREVPFPEGVQVEPSAPPTVLIFQGTPPTITLWSGTREVVDTEPVTLRLGTATRDVLVGSYGQVERRDDTP